MRLGLRLGIGRHFGSDDNRRYHLVIASAASRKRSSSRRLTVRTGDLGATLAGHLLDDATLAYRPHVWTDAQVAHEHAVDATAVEARLVRLDLVAVRVVPQQVVASLLAR